jgi:hypothetical protein
MKFNVGKLKPKEKKSINRLEFIYDFILRLEEFWIANSQERFGQLLYNYLLESKYNEKEGWIIKYPFHISDEDYLKHIKRLNKKKPIKSLKDLR